MNELVVEVDEYNSWGLRFGHQSKGDWGLGWREVFADAKAKLQTRVATRRKSSSGREQSLAYAQKLPIRRRELGASGEK